MMPITLPEVVRCPMGDAVMAGVPHGAHVVLIGLNPGETD